jgi:hypothetical protein
MSQAPDRTERTTPLSIRFTEAEKARLRALAGPKRLGSFIRERALGAEAEPRARADGPVKDAEPLGRILALLGQSRLANNLNQIARAANQGSLPVTAEVEAELQQACAAVFEMRLLLLRALGVKIVQEALDAPLSAPSHGNAGAE